MRKLLIFTTLSLLIGGCSKERLNYSAFNDIHILWDEIFEMESYQYYVYLYSTSCVHCQSIEGIILPFARKNKDAFYLLKETGSFVYKEEIEKTIGANTIENFYVQGVPTLVLITDHKIMVHLLGKTQIIGYIKNHS